MWIFSCCRFSDFTLSDVRLATFPLDPPTGCALPAPVILPASVLGLPRIRHVRAPGSPWACPVKLNHAERPAYALYPVPRRTCDTYMSLAQGFRIASSSSLCLLAVPCRRVAHPQTPVGPELMETAAGAQFVFELEDFEAEKVDADLLGNDDATSPSPSAPSQLMQWMLRTPAIRANTP